LKFDTAPGSINNMQFILGIEATLCIAFAVSLEFFLDYNKYAGAVAIYIGFVVLGFLVLAQVGWIWGKTRSLASTPPHQPTHPAAPPSPDQPPFPETTTPLASGETRPAKSGPATNSMAVVTVIAILFSLVFVPPLDLLFTGPDLEIYEAEGSGRSDKVSFDVIVINKGGIPAAGIIQLRIKNDTVELPAADTNRIEGFGKWEVKDTIYFNQSRTVYKKEKWYVILYYNGEKIEEVRLAGAPYCTIVPLLVIPAIAMVWFDARKHPAEKPRTKKK
jgi:hypothetical protein